jgi:SAM-dependent methyltransferase
MQSLLDRALSNPWGTLDALLDGPLHPGGREATADLLDRADVTADTTLLDVGCGAGDALAVARNRGARAVGIDQTPSAPGSVAGEMTALPVTDDSVDVVLSECVLCLADDLDRALSETHRVLAPGGRLALSDVVVDGDLSGVPDELARAFCLTGQRERAHLRERVATAGFEIAEMQDHRDDLLAMRDDLAGGVDYRGLLAAMGEQGERIEATLSELEGAVEDGRIGYVSLVTAPIA